MCIHSGDTLDEGELPFCHNSFCVVDVMERCYDFCIFLLLLDTLLLRSGAVQSSELFRFLTRTTYVHSHTITKCCPIWTMFFFKIKYSVYIRTKCVQICSDF